MLSDHLPNKFPTFELETFIFIQFGTATVSFILMEFEKLE